MLDSVSFSLLNEADAMAVLGAVEDLGRRVDAARVASAADIAVRSRRILGHESLAHKNGASNGVDLITRLTRISAREANRRVRLGDNVTPRLAGISVLPPYYPTVADALTAGDLGVDAAENIVAALDKVSARGSTTVRVSFRGRVTGLGLDNREVCSTTDRLDNREVRATA